MQRCQQNISGFSSVVLVFSSMSCIAWLVWSALITLSSLAWSEAELVLAWKIVVLIVFSDHDIYGHMDTQLFTFTAQVTCHTTVSGHGKIEWWSIQTLMRCLNTFLVLQALLRLLVILFSVCNVLPFCRMIIESVRNSVYDLSELLINNDCLALLLTASNMLSFLKEAGGRSWVRYLNS